MINEIANKIKGKFKNNLSHVIIAISGRGGSGKSVFAQMLAEELEDSAVLKLDNYRKSRREREGTGLLGSNPDANNVNLLVKHLELIKKQEEFEYPVYNEVSGEVDKSATFKPAKFNIIEGELVLYEKIVNQNDFIIVIRNSLVSLCMDRLKRDRAGRGYSLLKSIRVFLQSTVADYNKYYKPNSSKADLVLIRKGNTYKVPKSIR